MAEINLLKQQTGPSDLGKSLLPWVERLLILAILAMIGYYAWTVYSIHNTQSKIADLSTTLSQKKAQALASPDRKQLITRQAQTQELNKLVSAHEYWSGILPELSKVILKDARLQSFKADDTGAVALGVVVPNISELDKFLQIFDQPAFNQNFYNLRVSGVSTLQDKGVIYTNFTVLLNYSTSLLKPNNQASK